MVKKYPLTRPRRARINTFAKKLNQQIYLTPEDFIQPLFITDATRHHAEIENMPDTYRLGEFELLQTAERCQKVGIPAVSLFPHIDKRHKSAMGEESYNPTGLVQRRVRKLRKEFPNLGVIGDVALDPYTSHGQDGIVSDSGLILNDKTVEVLCKQSLSLAEAGANSIAPSDMMDGRIGAIRKSLESNGYDTIFIISYCAKFASHFYSPFRKAIDSFGNLGTSTKHSYQMDFCQIDEALLEAQLDENEGADALMVKPALPYLDIIRNMSNASFLPIYAFQVSGEYALLKAGAHKGIFNFKDSLHESLIAIKRSGARAIISYGALEYFEK